MKCIVVERAADSPSGTTVSTVTTVILILVVLVVLPKFARFWLVGWV